MSDTSPPHLIYHPTVFDVEDLSQAKEIILTNEGPGCETEVRWARETPYLGALIGQELALTPDSLVLDYGCGVGRLAKQLIDVYGCAVIGADISPRMRALALDYVGSDRFAAVDPGQLQRLCDKGLRVDAAFSVWVLQHCLTPAEDIARIRASLCADGRLFVANMDARAIPVRRPDQSELIWVSDGLDIWSLLGGAFAPVATGQFDPDLCPSPAHLGTTAWRTYRQGAG
ncbi:class I SAM-dependent methyltransferase [Acidisoma sp. 7E03]